MLIERKVKRSGWVHIQFGCGPKWTGKGGTRAVYLTPKGSDERYTWLVQLNKSESGQGSAGQIIVRKGDIISANTTSISQFNKLTLFPFS